MNPAIIAQLQGRPPGAAVIAALEKLLADDSYLLYADASERSITHRFAMHLQDIFTNWSVDCEYNRNGLDPKRLNDIGLVNAADGGARTVFPDVIVHRRGRQENHLVIEFKKSSNAARDELDLAKLRDFKRDLRFEFALFIKLATEYQADVAEVRWVDLEQI
jgi:hypothetical protein